MKIKLYNEEINIRTHYCQLNDCQASCVEEPYVNLYVKFTGCNAKCPFCIDDCLQRHFDTDKLKEILETIQEKVKIRKVSFTGGEPTLDIDRLEKSFALVKQYSPDTFTVINTNGYNLKGIFNSNILKNVDSVSLSRHHYSNKRNDEIFGSSVPWDSEIAELTQDEGTAKKMHFSCNLIKGYIDNLGKIENYLEHANALRVHDVGFVSLMPLNKYCKNNSTPFIDGGRLMKMKEWNYKTCCECANYLYLSKKFYGETVKVYHRNPKSPMDFENMLMYDGAILRVGFNGKILTMSDTMAWTTHQNV